MAALAEEEVPDAIKAQLIEHPIQRILEYISNKEHVSLEHIETIKLYYNQFIQFAFDNLCEEPFEFMYEVRGLRALYEEGHATPVQINKIKTKMSKIFDDFIQRSSPKQINIAPATTEALTALRGKGKIGNWEDADRQLVDPTTGLWRTATDDRTHGAMFQISQSYAQFSRPCYGSRHAKKCKEWLETDAGKQWAALKALKESSGSAHRQYTNLLDDETDSFQHIYHGKQSMMSEYNIYHHNGYDLDQQQIGYAMSNPSLSHSDMILVLCLVVPVLVFLLFVLCTIISVCMGGFGYILGRKIAKNDMVPGRNKLCFDEV